MRLKSRQNTKLQTRIGALAVAFTVILFVNLLQAKEKKDSKKSVLKSLSYTGQESDKVADKKSLMTEMLVRKSEKLAIGQLKALIKKHRGKVVEPDLWHRLSELYMRRAKGDRNVELHRKSEYAVSVAPKLVKSASSKGYIRKAIEVYTKIQKRFKKFDRMDLVVFNNAFARQMLGHKKEAERLYWKVVRSYPYSRLVPDCHLAIGEMAFNQMRFKFALEHFDAVKKYPNSRVYPYSVYKAGWTKYNLRDALGGMREMEEVVRYGRHIHANGIDARLDLRKEALADMTIFYEDVYPAKNAFSYFKEQSGDLDVAPTILRLANIYKRHSRYVDRNIVLQMFEEELPNSDRLPEVQEDLVRNFEAMRKRPLAVAQLKKFDKICRPESSWVRHKDLAKERGSRIKACTDQLRNLSLQMAGKWLRMWKKNSTYPLFADSSETAFRIYLKHDDQSQKAKESRVAYADLLFQRKKFRAASAQYAIVGGSKDVKGKLGHDSRYSAILSLEKAVKEKWSDEDEKSFHRLAKSYVSNHPRGKFRLDIEFKQGLIAYEKSRYAEAGKVFYRLGEDYASNAKGKKSQDLYLDILNHLKDYQGLKDYSSQLLSKSKSPVRQKKLAKIYEESYFLQVQKMETDGEKAKAAVGYQKFAKENLKSVLAPKAWWNSIQLYYSVGENETAAKSAMKYYKLFPKEKNVLDGVLKAAQTYESMAQLTRAAEVLEVLIELDKKSSVKWSALAADFYALSDNQAKALDLYTKLSKSSDNKLAAYALSQLNDWAIKSRIDNQKHLKNMLALGVEPQASMAQLKILEQVEAQGNDSETFLRARKLVGRSSAPKSVKAKARFIQAKVLEREFRKQSVKTRLEKVALVLSMKTEKLEKAQRAYQAAIRYGDPHVAVESLQRLAGSYDHYSKALKAMPAPKGLPIDEVPGFRNEIAKLIIPIEEKSIDTLIQALTEAKRLKLRNGVVAKIQKEVDRINMKKDGEPVLEVKLPVITLATFARVSQ